MIFEHLFGDNFCDNFLSHSHIISYFISLLFLFPCKYLLFSCKLWLSHKLSTKLVVQITLLNKQKVNKELFCFVNLLLFIQKQTFLSNKPKVWAKSCFVLSIFFYLFKNKHSSQTNKKWAKICFVLSIFFYLFKNKHSSQTNTHLKQTKSVSK